MNSFISHAPNNNTTAVDVCFNNFTAETQSGAEESGLTGIVLSADANSISAAGGTLAVKADITPSNAENKNLEWKVVNPDLTASDAAELDQNGVLTAQKNGMVLVTATAKDGGGTMGMYPVEITGQQTFAEFVPVSVLTAVGKAPVLPQLVYEKNNDGTVVPANVQWDTVAPKSYAQAGQFTVDGTVAETASKVHAEVTVSSQEVRSVNPVIVKATPGSLKLPNQVTAIMTDGTEKLVSVNWEQVDAANYAKENVSGFQVSGTVSGTEQKASAYVSVLPVVVKNVTPILVAADGTGDFKTVKEALQSIPEANSTRRVIFVKNGTYKEKLVFDRPYVTLAGESADGTVITNDDSPMKNTVNGTSFGTYNDYTVQVTGQDFSAQNITVENSAGSTAGQAVALDVYADHARFENCRILGYQDTLLTRNRTDTSQTDNVPNQPSLQTYRQYFKNCYIAGSVDYIFGASEAIFEGCELHSRLSGYVTAADTPQNQPYGYVFLNCRLTGDRPYGNYLTVTLGRTWRSYSAVAYLNCAMDQQIAANGWATMSNTNDSATARYAEYKCTGAGAGTTGRVTWAKQLTDAQAAQYIVKNVFQAYKAENDEHNIYSADSWDSSQSEGLPKEPTGPTSIPAVGSLTDTETGIKVSDTHSVLPQGTNLQVVKEPVSSQTYAEAKNKLPAFLKQAGMQVFDMTLQKSGSMIQPSGKVTVLMPIPKGADAEKLVVYRISQNGAAVRLSAVISGAALSFESDTLGEYVLAELNTPVGVKVTMNDGTVQQVAPDDVIQIPLSGTFKVNFASSQRVNAFRYTSGNGEVLQTGTANRWADTSGVYSIYAHGTVGQTAGVYVNGILLFKAKIVGRPLKSDTTVDFALPLGKTYTFYVQPDKKVQNFTFSTANGAALQTSAVKGCYPDHSGRYYCRVTVKDARKGYIGVYCIIDGATYKLFAVCCK